MFFLPDNEANIARLYYKRYRLDIGEIFIASSEQAIVFLAFPSPGLDLAEELRKLFPQSDVIAQPHPLHHEALVAIQKPKAQRRLPLYACGTAFQKMVWTELLKIPYAERVTYGEIAKRIGKPQAQRAVGTAIGKNRIAILIPCHRVVPIDGSIGSYRWGSAIKARILAFEKKIPSLTSPLLLDFSS